MYQHGLGCKKNQKEAIKWYTLASEQGIADAQNNLAYLYEGNQQYSEAVHWYQQAAERGHVGAHASLGYAYSKGRGVPIDEAEAMRFYRVAAERGHAIAQTNLGNMYAEGRGCSAEPPMAAHWIQIAADQGYAPAQLALARLYSQGFGVELNESEALKWLRHAASQGLTDAQFSLAIHFANAGDKLHAFIWFTAAAVQGNPDAAQRIEDLQLDQNTEICQLIIGAGSGDSEAQATLALKLQQGDGISPDEDASIFWLRKAAESGDAWAQSTYAIVLRKTQDPDKMRESVHWFSTAARQGDTRARFNLGLMQLVGDGTPVDHLSAAVNIMQASLAGFEDSRAAFETVRPMVSEGSWGSIFDQVQWPDLTFILGPLAEGHMDAVRESQENDDGSDDALWLEYERGFADTMFLCPTDRAGSLLDTAFGEPVTIRKIFVGRAIFRGKPVAAITINLRNIRLPDDFPVYWSPSNEGLNSVSNMIGYVALRNFVQQYYTYF